MSKRLDLAGKKFGMLTAIEVVGKYRSFALWRCLCDCGNESRVPSVALTTSGHLTRSCGCQKDAPRTREEIEQHLLKNRRITKTGCWEWTRARNEYGYGITAALGLGWRRIRVTRLAMHLWRGFDPNSDIDILHRCDNPPCFNPDHLFEGTAKVNTADSMGKGRWRTGEFQRNKTHCKRGHEFTPENIYPTRNGTARECLTCKRMHSAKHSEKRRQRSTEHGRLVSN